MVQTNPIPWARPTLFGTEEPLVLDALRSTWISGGPYVDRLEREMAATLGSPHAIAVSNGTVAIELALRALDLQPGDEVIVPAFTFVAAPSMVLSTGLKPLFADVDEETFLMDPSEIARLSGPRTKAVIPVHLYGNVADMDRIRAAASQLNLAVIEDAAEATFSRRGGSYAGTMGTFGTFSFHATKTISTGEGGLVVTEDGDLAQRCRILRDHGMRPGKRYWHDVAGHNFRMTNLQAAVGCGQLEALDTICSQRHAIYRHYRQALSGVDGIMLQKFDEAVDPVVWVTTVRLDLSKDIEACRQRRDRIMAAMAAEGIETRPGFYDASQLPPYDCDPLPHASRVSASTIALPTFVGLTVADIDRICDSLKRHLHAT